MNLRGEIIEKKVETPGKREDEQLTARISHCESTPEERIHHLDEARIRIMLCVSFTN